MTAKRWLEELNPAQRDAVTFGEGPLLVIAGAGTGKTRTLACRVAYLLEQGVAPDRLLLLTFTRRAAAEMLSRAAHLTGIDTVQRVWGGTFHSVANRLLRLYGRAVGLGPDFTVMDQDDAADLMNLVRNELGLAKGDRRFPRKTTLAKIYSHTRSAQRALSETLERYFPWCLVDQEEIATLFRAYTERKQQREVLDFDDLLLFWDELCHAPAVGARIADRFEHILVDEYQDTNAVQGAILRAMRRSFQNIMVVGDDAQSIYSFRAATIRNILDFPKQFPGAHQVTLEENYRSSRSILGAANAVMDEARERFTKSLWSTREATRKPVLCHCENEEQQSLAVCRQVLALYEGGIPLQRQAVLFRAGHHSADLEIALTRSNVPFHKFGGLKFIEAAHIKDLLALLRVLQNPHDEISWFRVLQFLPGVGPRTARRIMDQLEVGRARAPAGGDVPDVADAARGADTAEPDELPDEPVVSGVASPMRRFLSEAIKLPGGAQAALDELRKAWADCCGHQLGESDNARPADGRSLPVAVQLERLAGFYRPVLERVHDQAEVRWRDVEQLVRIAGRYRSRSRLITDLTLDPPASTADFAGAPHLDEDWLTLSTIHSAKGCEWDAVYILHAADGMIPSDMALHDSEGIEEERRLFYVALTRAREYLYVYFPLRYYHRRYATGDGHTYAQLTRFLPKKTLRHFEVRSVDPDGQAPEVARPVGGAASGRPVRRALDELWDR